MPRAAVDRGTGFRLALPVAMVLAACLSIAHAAEATPPSSSVTTQKDDDDLTPPALTIHLDRREVALDGDLADGTAKRLRAILRGNPGLNSLSLESDGGLVDEAEQIGDIVSAHGLVTVVRGFCVSACTLAYVRGRARLATDGARLGFHAPWITGEGGTEQQVASDEERQAYLAAGISAEFVTEALAVPAASVWFPDGARLLEARVVTDVMPAERLAARLATLGDPRKLAAAE